MIVLRVQKKTYLDRFGTPDAISFDSAYSVTTLTMSFTGSSGIVSSIPIILSESLPMKSLKSCTATR